MPKEVKEELGLDGLPGHDYFLDAVNHIQHCFKTIFRIHLGQEFTIRMPSHNEIIFIY